MCCLGIVKLMNTVLNNWIWCVGGRGKGNMPTCLRKQRWVQLCMSGMASTAFSGHYHYHAFSASRAMTGSRRPAGTGFLGAMLGPRHSPAQLLCGAVLGLHRSRYEAFCDTCQCEGLGGGILLSPVLIEAGHHEQV